MSKVSNAFDSYTATGNREDLSDLISIISPLEAPAYDRFGSVKANGRLHEWQTDSLAAAAANSNIEGEAFAGTARTPTNRLNNICQVMIKQFSITDTQNIVDKAGRSSESAYQKTKALKELKRDCEFALFASAATASITGISGATSVAPLMRSINDWQIGVVAQTGVSGQVTAVTMTEQNFNANLQTAWGNGAKINTVYCGGAIKRVISAWATTTSRPRDIGTGTKIVQRVDVYDSDFGQLDIVLDRYVGSSSVFMLDDNLWKKAELVPVREKAIADTGLAANTMIWTQWTLEARNPTGNAMFFSGP
jgi:hypothetical protein